MKSMGHKRVRWWVALLLPGFLLRALIPVGFMPAIGPDHSVRLVICDSYAPMPMMDMEMDAHTDMPVHGDMPMHAGGKGSPVHQEHGGCPYGYSPALGALPTLSLGPLVVQRAAPLVVAAPQIVYFQVPPRAQSPRGPPV